MRWFALGAPAFIAFSLLAVPCTADGPASLTAREHFERGVEASQHGELALALEHFEHAQRLAPNQTVLYNLGQTYSALGKPVEALAALQAYIEGDGASGDPARRREVEALAARNEERVGMLEIAARPSDASVEIDGATAKLAADGGVRVAVGSHLVTATRSGYRPLVLRVEAHAGRSTPVRLELEPVGAERGSYVEATCPTPEVSVAIDGISIGQTPRLPLVPVASGLHRFRFERRGYVAWEAAVEVKPKTVARVRCELSRDAALPASESAELRVLASHPNVRIMVNGVPFRPGRVPLGAHAVEVTAPGYRPWSGVVTVRAGLRNDVRISLELTPERRRADEARSRRLVAYTAGGVGVAMGGIASVLYATNLSRYEDWLRDHRELERDLSRGESGPEQAERAADLHADAARIQRTDDLALGLGVVSGVFLAVSIGLLLTSNEPDTSHVQRRADHPFRFSF